MKFLSIIALYALPQHLFYCIFKQMNCFTQTSRRQIIYSLAHLLHSPEENIHLSGKKHPIEINSNYSILRSCPDNANNNKIAHEEKYRSESLEVTRCCLFGTQVLIKTTKSFPIQSQRLIYCDSIHFWYSLRQWTTSLITYFG